MTCTVQGITDQHYALIIIHLFITPAPTCFSTYVPSSGSVLYPYELLERQKWLCCSHVPPTFTVHDYNTTISAFQVTHNDKGRSLKMAHKC
jgi:hypothetical protein